MVDYVDILRYLKTPANETELAAFHEVESRYRIIRISNYLRFFVGFAIVSAIAIALTFIGITFALIWLIVISAIVEVIGVIALGCSLASSNRDAEDLEFKEADKIKERVNSRA